MMQMEAAVAVAGNVGKGRERDGSRGSSFGGRGCGGRRNDQCNKRGVGIAMGDRG